jgi:hypothetical protein
VGRHKTRRPGEITIQPPCTPQTCDWHCRACLVHGRPFHSHDDVQCLEHGTGPLAAELNPLWRAKGTGRGRTARQRGPWY